MKLEQLYQEIILDHYRNPHRRGLREPYDAEVHHVNPTCGDEVTLRVRLASNGSDATVEDVSYDALGCSISQAATSVLTDLVVGRTVRDSLSTLDSFVALMLGRGEVEPDEEVLEDGVAFAGVARYPARVKCALLGWMAFKDAVARSVDAVDPMLKGARCTMTQPDIDQALPDPAPPPPPVERASLEDLEEAMRDVVDPELGINVVDLGLVYDIRVDDAGTATIDMTLTSAACPLTDVIEDQTRAALVEGPGGGLVSDVKINWVWMPPWGPDKITEDGREQLRALGFTV